MSFSEDLIGKYGNSLDLEVEIGSVRDRERLETIFNRYRPEIVFHAAAKHVPLMEHSCCECQKQCAWHIQHSGYSRKIPG